jgi:voltage-gated potassium channel
MNISGIASQQFEVLRLPEQSVVPGLLRRLALILLLIAAATIVLWVTRSGLVDNTHPTKPLSFMDVLYFAIVSLTTVGYGDIVPVTPEARFINAILLTPVRVFLWAVFLGTAYELTLQKYREQVQMKKLKEQLQNHSIVCGFGVKGRTIAAELMAHGAKAAEIIVIEPNEDAIQHATKAGLVALRGDASSEEILRAAGIDKASQVLVALDEDDICVLICLTVRHLNPSVRLVASVREEENIKLLRAAGADVIVSPSITGGRLMSAAISSPAVTEFMQDLLSFGQGIDAVEHIVNSEQEGKLVGELQGKSGYFILGVARGKKRWPFPSLESLRLKKGDVIIYLMAPPFPTNSTGESP